MALNFKKHCASALILRLVLIAYADLHDKYFSVPYTDVDYKVYTDASRLLLTGKSPYERHTYRYTPLLALILTPNIFLYQNFGKILFSIIDVIIGILMKHILMRGQCNDKVSAICALVWLYCPLTIVISTRGNADSVAVVLVLLTLNYLISDNSFLSGIIHGISVHFRLYPIAFSLVMYLGIADNNFFPNARQIKLVSGCILSLGLSTLVSYYFYGYQFIHESLIYHLIRKDARHNFSAYFYMQYLSIGQSDLLFEKLVRILPPVIILIALSFRYSRRKDLPFAMLTQAMVMVTYNSVITSQYFFWYLSLLPLCLPYIKIGVTKLVILIAVWIASQGLWLLDAYALEFVGINSFQSIWISSLIFFVVNVKILVEVITKYENKLEYHSTKKIK
ncbi:GPI mannosyltransferase 1 [Fopius arisanus]|uniref:GPI alpha-1,4-mannosyltransferase I, catalytic subunit n=1 Tax=Fopius arisanus TaxID=64838 RepID=A0A9R1SZR5_9HYME|nr:PREDICTED: GPI mannosyltransferase 1 [Fopius arisanus]